MTPDEARALLDGTTPGPWEVRTSESGDTWLWAPVTDDVYGPRQPFEVCFYNSLEDVALAAAAPDMARTIAGMRTQYRAEYRLADGTWAMYDVEKCDGWTTVYGFARGQAAELARTGAAVRIVRRYVTEPEEA